MPKIEPVPEAEIEAVELDIRLKIMKAGSNVTKVADLLNKTYPDRVENKQTLNRQINQGILPAWKERRIATVLGYNVTWSNDSSRN
jgi:hypothetical protein